MAITIKRRSTVEQRKLGETKRMGTNNTTTQQQKSRISLWEVEATSDKSPVARGTIQLTVDVVVELYGLIQDGAEMVELGVSIWNNDSENERAPTFTGLVKSPSERAADMEKSSNKPDRSAGMKRKTR